VENPWADLPASPPYVLAQDRAALAGARDIRPDVLPVPFLGSPDRAQLYLLALNPGFGPDDVAVQQTNSYFAEQHRLSLMFRSAYPFWCLDPALAGTPGYRWWTARLRQLASIVGWDALREQLMCVQYFPYRSRTFDSDASIPSQEFSFGLVRRALLDKTPIVFMRSRRLWERAVPELASYACYELLNPRAPFVTEANLRAGDFKRIVQALQVRGID